ncbi:hypothetical protein D9615_001518 [Tricholomella constricta]|uniref:SUN domain-containing protein n=1 Tax=Tricholomella constricta TaxID=117010 RepID=A0A8H5M911_9AGAR|nr:hypothetical protein D9615_010545 [Tricholomella constricta]KAF5385192.1 hypothetical protein D9615_001518 [Tricholomella constricta]
MLLIIFWTEWQQRENCDPTHTILSNTTIQLPDFTHRMFARLPQNKAKMIRRVIAEDDSLVVMTERPSFRRLGRKTVRVSLQYEERSISSLYDMASQNKPIARTGPSSVKKIMINVTGVAENQSQPLRLLAWFMALFTIILIVAVSLGCALWNMRPSVDMPPLNIPLLHPPVQRDFAIHAQGSSIIPQLTSPTHGLRKHIIPSFSWMMYRVRGYDISTLHIRAPTVMLEEDTHVGACWKFSGSKGHFTISLPTPVHISDIAFYYPVRDLLSPLAAQQAPQNITIWGFFSKESMTRFPQPTVPAMRALDFFGLKKLSTRPDWQEAMLFPLTQFTFTLSPTSNYQRFGLPSRNTTLPLDTIVVEIMSNWGAPTTCIYRIGVYGDKS